MKNKLIFHIGVIIRKKGTPISNKMLEDIKKNKGILNCHSHPYISDLRVSSSDLQLSKIINWQYEFYVISPDGLIATYTKDGIKNVDVIKNELTEEKMKFYDTLFGGMDND